MWFQPKETPLICHLSNEGEYLKIDREVGAIGYRMVANIKLIKGLYCLVH